MYMLSANTSLQHIWNKNSIRNEYFMTRRHVHSKMKETYREYAFKHHSSSIHSYILPYKNPCLRGRIIIIVEVVNVVVTSQNRDAGHLCVGIPNICSYILYAGLAHCDTQHRRNLYVNVCGLCEYVDSKRRYGKHIDGVWEHIPISSLSLLLLYMCECFGVDIYRARGKKTITLTTENQSKHTIFILQRPRSTPCTNASHECTQHTQTHK